MDPVSTLSIRIKVIKGLHVKDETMQEESMNRFFVWTLQIQILIMDIKDNNDLSKQVWNLKKKGQNVAKIA